MLAKSSTLENNLVRFGFRLGRGGAHLARSMMLDDLRRLLEHMPDPRADRNDFAAAGMVNGLPEPESDDPTQWLFHGDPGGQVEAASCRFPDSACRPSDDSKTAMPTDGSRDALQGGTRQDAASTLQVAVAWLLGYRWPAELEDPHPNPPRGRGDRKDAAERPGETVGEAL